LARLGLVFGTIAAASALISGPAGASTPEVFAGSSSGNALNLSIAGTNLTGGLSVANVKSNLTADAEGAGIFTPGQVQDLKTAVNGNNQTQSKPNACLQTLPALPAPLNALSLSLACSSSTSSVTGNNPTADATGLIAHLGVANLSGIPQLSSALGQLGSQLKAIPQLGPILNQVVSSVQSGQVLDAQFGPSESSITTDAGAVTSKASAQGTVIKLLGLVPTATPSTTAVPNVSLGPLVTITIGQAAATATFDRHTGKSTGTFDPALVRVSLNLPGQAPQTFSVVPGVDQSIPPAGTPGAPTLVSLKVGSGKTTTNPDGSVSSAADALSLAVLPGMAPGGKDVLDLQLAHAQASAGGALATLTAAPHPPTLPFTGEHPWIPYAGLGFLGGALGLGFLAYRGGFRFGFRRS
jgi:hypothetical protein